MRLSSVRIQNFRGIRDLTFELEPDVTVLIGENNSGKTSVLEALRFGLDTIKSDKTCSFTEYDFLRTETTNHVSQCDRIILTYFFKETAGRAWDDEIVQALDEVIVSDEFSLIKLRVSAWFDMAECECKQELSFLDDKDNEMTGKQWKLKDLQRIRPFFFLSALRNAKQEFQAQSIYWASFLKNKDIDSTTQEALEQELATISKKIVDAHGTFRDVAKEMKRISELVSTAKTDAVSIDPAPVDVYRTLRYNTQVNILTPENAKIPLQLHGEGTQSLSVLLLFNAYLNSRLKQDVDKLAEPIIAIEEPEAHLHPNAIRSLWGLLCELPGQKIIATHSGDIISEVPVNKLRRMNKCGSDIICRALSDGTLAKEELRKFKHHVRRNRGELLFAKCWILVEGETDVLVIAECAELLSINLSLHGIRIVECSQAGGPSIFIKVADALGVQWHLVADNDQGGEKYITHARTHLNGRDEAHHITKLTQSNMDILLCCNGYGKPYRDGVPDFKTSELTAKEGSPEYWSQVYKIIKDIRSVSKPAAAMESMILMQQEGEGHVPSEINVIINKAIALTRGFR
jgi:putative ATP-dependent endonuclease of OLD family